MSYPPLPDVKIKSNRVIRRLDVSRCLSDRGFNLIDEMLELYRDPETTNKERMHCCEVLLKYCAPQLKAVSLEDKRQGSLNCNITFDNSVEADKDVLEELIGNVD